jgi:hypothetical protein
VSSEKVDLSQIRGDWDFHSRYVTNAVEQTLKRVNKTWKQLKAASRKKGQVPVDGALMEEFMEACAQTRALCDDYLILAETQGQKVVRKKTRKRAAASKASKKAAKKAAKKPAKKARTKISKKTSKKTTQKRGADK